MRPLKLLIVFFLLVGLTGGGRPGWAAGVEDLFQAAEKARAALLDNKESQKFRHNWLNVVARYEKVVKQEAEGKLAQKALMAMGDLYLGLYRVSRLDTDLDQALEQFRRLTQNFPQEPAAAEAQLKIGEIYYDYKKDYDRAYVEFLKVELNHPRSKPVAEARKMMARIAGPSKMHSPEIKPSPGTEPLQVDKVSAVVQGLRYWANPTYSRIAIDLDREVSFRDHLLRPDPALNKPMRLYLDLSQARIAPGVQEELPIADGLLRKARVGQHNQDTVRVVLDIQNINNYRIFSLTDPFRIVVDVSGDQGRAEDKPEPEKESTAKAAPQTPPGPPGQPLADLRETAQKRKKVPRGPAQTKEGQDSLARQLGLGIRRIVLDPGHGGKDHGATGITGLREKDLTLKFARLLAERIEKQLGLEVVLTRDRDEFLPLEERTAIANTKCADLFISIHANAHKDPGLTGVETYFLNLATDAEAMRVAARENATSTKNMSDLQIILNDLMLNSKITESSRLGAKVHQAMVGRLKKRYKNIRDLGVKQAPFYVLIGANMPSILVELGFVSNKLEEGRLRSKAYQDQLADGIIEGIKVYVTSSKRGV